MMVDTDALLKAAKLMVAATVADARIKGMEAENTHRLSCGESIAYGSQEFEYVAATLEAEAGFILRG